MSNLDTPTEDPQQDGLASDGLLNLLHDIEPKLASVKKAHAGFVGCVAWNVSVYGRTKGCKMSEVYLVGMEGKLGVVTGMLVDASGQYMSLVLSGVCPADKMETIEDGLRSLRADHDTVLRYLGGVRDQGRGVESLVFWG
ncbi:hypothetical protein Q9L58_001653 [Maublancomyces gigas]|uniref:Uncharacterized protein n=1 Tax=Discina gigas TaxID=1032678 RepID=A0ABR3GTE3_9PEZI